jgi:hypothetical protein
VETNGWKMLKWPMAALETLVLKSRMLATTVACHWQAEG